MFLFIRFPIQIQGRWRYLIRLGLMGDCQVLRSRAGMMVPGTGTRRAHGSLSGLDLSTQSMGRREKLRTRYEIRNNLIVACWGMDFKRQ